MPTMGRGGTGSRSPPYEPSPEQDSTRPRPPPRRTLAGRRRPRYRYGMSALPDPVADRPRAAPAGFATESRLAADLLDELGRVIVGQRALLERMIIGLLADGHVLLEGVPGLAK